MSNTATNYDPVTYWNARAKDYAPGELGVLGENLLKWYKTYTWPKFTRVLEVGSGNGRIYQLLAGEVLQGRYRICDISSSMAAQFMDATGKPPEIWDGKTLPYLTGLFDWVISANVLLHVPPADLDGHLCELARVSRRYVFVSTYTGPGEGLASHCFAHDYELAFERAGLVIEAYAGFEKEKQGQWLLTV